MNVLFVKNIEVNLHHLAHAQSDNMTQVPENVSIVKPNVHLVLLQVDVLLVLKEEPTTHHPVHAQMVNMKPKMNVTIVMSMSVLLVKPLVKHV